MIFLILATAVSWRPASVANSVPDSPEKSIVHSSTKFFNDGEKIPIKIRKLATSLPQNSNGYVNMNGFRAIHNEGSAYQALYPKNDAANYMLPFLAYKEEGHIRYINFYLC